MKKIALATLLLAATPAPSWCTSYNDLNAGIAYFNGDAWANAVVWLSKAIDAGDLIPDQMRVARMDRGLAQANLQRYDLAVADYSAILELQPADPEILVARATANWNAGKLDEAATDLDRLVAARPLLSVAYDMRATINAKRGLADKSREDLKKVLSLLPENAERTTNTGIINWQVGQIEDADDNFYHAATRGKGNVYAWLWYALTEVRLGKKLPRRSLPDFDKTQWPASIVSYFLGDIAQDAAFTAAGQGQADAVKGQICEANFYIGEWLLQHHDPSAKAMLGKAASDCPMNFMEWSPAQMDLAGLP
jgi:lipoprotein NlpI